MNDAFDGTGEHAAGRSSKSSLELEMFEVGLGSSIYMRLRGPEEDVRILADGGVGPGYQDDHVLKKLWAVFEREGAVEPRIDLMIATHYDEDHLKGLVPIVRAGIAIGDVWLPPVADEDKGAAFGARPRRSDMLGETLSTSEGLRSFLRNRARELKRAQRFLALLGEEPGDVNLAELDSIAHHGDDDDDSDAALERLVAPFRIALVAAGAREGGCEHVEDADLVGEPPSLDELERKLVDEEWRALRYLNLIGRQEIEFRARRLRRLGLANPAISSLKHLTKSVARKAINGTGLHRLRRALATARIKPQYLTIPRGQPEDFRWDAGGRRFEPASGRNIAPTQIALLGPSDWLVTKFRDRLPTRDATYMAFTSRLHVKPTTPSNDLSYVISVTHAGQSVLISGDTGLWDFTIGRTGFEPLLVDRLRDLSVVQVAHHAGNNRWFYPALEEAWRGRMGSSPLLLISHAEDDAHRPNDEFRKFVRRAWDPKATNLLFTSRPLPERVEHVDHRFHPIQGVTSPRARGDVRLTGGADGWTVLHHVVKV